MANPMNPDARPLPPGWNQHYDAHTGVWYYVCMTMHPPTVSTTHPLGTVPDGNVSSTSFPSPEYSYTQELLEAEPSNTYSTQSLSPISPAFPPAFDAFPERPITTSPLPPPSNAGSRPLPSTSNVPGGQRPVSYNPPPSTTAPVQPRASGLTFAQQLYSSSVRTAPVGSHQTSSSSMPTPPTSPQPRSSRSAAPILPPPPPPNARSTNENDLFRVPVIPDSRSYTAHRASVHSSPHYSPSLGTFPKAATHSMGNHPAPHRTQSYQPPKPAAHPNPHRTSTIPAGVGFSKTRGVPQLTTTARPPPNATHAATKLHTTPSFQPISSPPPQLPQNPALASPVPSYPTPPNSGGPVATLNATAYQAQTSLPLTPAMQVQLAYQNQTQIQQQPMQMQQQPMLVQAQQHVQVQPQNLAPGQQQQPQTQVQVQPQNPATTQQQQQKPQQNAMMKQAGIGFGKFALKVAGGAVASSLGLEVDGIAGAIGGALVNAVTEDSDVTGSVVDGIAGVVGGAMAQQPQQQDPMAQLQAAMAQQQAQQQDPMAQLQAAMAQQQAQQQDPMAQLQAAMAQQQAQQQQPMAQFQVALAQQQAQQQQAQPMAQFQAAMAQQQAQQQQLLQQQAMQQQAMQQQAQQVMAQQQAQQQQAAIAAFQQQQQQQQLQLQMQMQLLQQQQQQPQAAAVPQNAPLNTFLTGFGQVLSGMAADNTAAADQGGSWDAYASFLSQEAE